MCTQVLWWKYWHHIFMLFSKLATWVREKNLRKEKTNFSFFYFPKIYVKKKNCHRAKKRKKKKLQLVCWNIFHSMLHLPFLCFFWFGQPWYYILGPIVDFFAGNLGKYFHLELLHIKRRLLRVNLIFFEFWISLILQI